MNVRIRLILLISLFASLQNSSTGVIFPQTPATIAIWEIDSPNNNHLGEVIKATLRLTTQPDTTVDTSQLPDVGDILPLPPKLDNTSTAYPHYDMQSWIPEGELEVVSRRITSHIEEGLTVTEIDYELQYLLPLDLTSPTDDKRLPWNVPVYQRYFQFFAKTGKVESVTTNIFAEMTDFYITPRVDENTPPIFKLLQLTPPRQTAGPLVRLAGVGLIALAFVFPVGRLGCLIKARLRQRQDQIANALPTASKLYLSWCENPDQAIFIEALKLYRRGIWGRPQASTWITTTFILYSGVSLNQEQAKSVFARLVKEVGDELPT